MKFLITGGCGFLGANLTAEALRRNETVCVVDNLSRVGTEANVEWLRRQGDFDFQKLDTRDFQTIESLIRRFRPDVVFHLAGQVAMTTSIADPRLDFEINVCGGHNVLESVRRHAPEATVLYSSTNKVYGDLEYVRYEEAGKRYVASEHPNGFDELTRLDFRSPYGVSKGAIDQYMLDYARMFGVKTVVFRHSSIFGGRQFSTFDQGWIGWFVQKALETREGKLREDFTISGSGKQVRDVLFASDLVELYFQAVKHSADIRGEVFNIGGGMVNSLSLLELFDALNQELGIELKYRQLPWRQSDQKVFVADIRKIQRAIGWAPKVGKIDGLRRMIEWTRDALK